MIGIGRFSRLGIVVVAVAVLAAGIPAQADEVELRDGTKYLGLVLEQSTHSVKFKQVFPSGSSMVRFIAKRKIKNIVIDGIEPKPEGKPKPKPTDESEAEADSPSTPKKPGRPPRRSVQEVENLIKLAGVTREDWWDEVELSYPDTLDLPGTNRAEGWRPDINVGTFIWERINKKPKKWRMGAKLLHHVVEVRRRDVQRRAEAMEMLGGLYFNLLNDWARAAYWYDRAFAVRRRASVQSVIALAECYWRLGSRRLAVATLKRYRMDLRMPSQMAAMLWCEMGDTVGAMKMAERLIGVPRRADEGYLAAGNISRYQGKLDEAIVYYRQAANVTAGSNHLEMNKQRAAENLKAVQALKHLDLTKVTDGTYEGEALGYRGPVKVKVHVDGGKITQVEIVNHVEDVFYSAFLDVPERIVASQGLQHIDAVTGASATGEAVLNAATHALSAGQGRAAK